MESNLPLDSDFSKTLNINGDIRIFLKETAKWAQFIAIVGLVMMGLFLLAIIFMGSMFGALFGGLAGAEEFGGGGAAMSMLGGFGMFLYAIMIGVFIFPLVYLLRFAQNIKVALKSDNQESLTTAFQYLKSHYKFYGIFMAIMVGFYAIVFVFSLLGGLMAAF